MPVTVINSNDQLKAFLKKNKKVVVAIASPGLAHCDGMKGEIETLSIKYPDIVFVSVDGGEFPPKIGEANNYLVPWVTMYEKEEKFGDWTFIDKVSLAEKIEAFANAQPLTSAEPLRESGSE